MTLDEIDSAWPSWKARLASGNIPSVAPIDFAIAMCRPEISAEAINMAKNSETFRNALQGTFTSAFEAICERIFIRELSRVLSVLDVEWIAQNMLQVERKKISSMETRVIAVSGLSRFLCIEAGRQWVRDRAPAWWLNADFSEEEGDAFIRVLLSLDVHRIQDIELWGSLAAESASRVTRRGLIEGNIDWPVENDSKLSLVGNRTTPIWLRERASLLLQNLSIPVDLKDSGFQKTELDRLQNLQGQNAVSLPLWRQALERRFGMPIRMMIREFPELAMEFVSGSSMERKSVQNTSAVQLPLLRLMHMRLLLESPSLSDALRQSELSMIPDFILYLMGRDYVSYSPELRVFDSCERRWRARWVETTAEAMASLLLEDLLRFDLTTLSRIPESNEPTPDFLGETESREKIVFECKGATGWKTHRKQRMEALLQLGKGKTSKGGGNTWASNGRSFAISLFAAKQGDSKSSLLHVNDPIFMFNRLYDDSWEDRSRRAHFAGVLQSALLFDEADQLMRGVAVQSSDNKNTSSFEIDRGDDLSFVGSYLPIEDWARRLRHPDAISLKRLKVFIGIEKNRHSLLAAGKLPPRFFGLENYGDNSSSKRPNAESRDTVPRLTSRTTTLPSREFTGESRGVFSLLSNGSFLAIEIGP